MKRKTILLTVLVSLVVSPIVYAQEATPIPPYSSSDLLGPDLIAWTDQAKPQPVPAPLPDPPAQQQSAPSAQDEKSIPPTEQPASQTFTGRIIKDGGTYVLKTSSGEVYQIDDQQKAKGYEGREVKIVGTLGDYGHIARMISIEAIS